MKQMKYLKWTIYCFTFVLLMTACTSATSPGIIDTQVTEQLVITTTQQTPSLVQSPTPSPLPTPSPTPQPQVFTLTSAGDVVPHKTFQMGSYIPETKTFDYTDVFSEIKEHVSKADLSIIDVESAVVFQPDNYTGYPLFNTDPAFVDAVKWSGFDLFNNINNHSLDRRLAGYKTTRDNVIAAGIDVLGYQDGEPTRYKIYEQNGVRVAVMAYTYSYNGNEGALTVDEQYRHLALLDENRMQAELTAMEDEADVSVILLHWGVEYMQTPNQSQRDLAAKLFSWGADVLLGSHPHVIQPSEIVEVAGETKYIVYSMGNFLSNQRRGASGLPNIHKELAEDSMLIDITFEKNPETGVTVIKSVKHIPTWLWRYDDNGVYRFQIIPVPALDDPYLATLPKDVQNEAKASYERTMPLMTDYSSKD